LVFQIFIKIKANFRLLVDLLVMLLLKW